MRLADLIVMLAIGLGGIATLTGATLVIACFVGAVLRSASRDLPVAPAGEVIPFPARLRAVGDDFDRIDPAPWPAARLGRSADEMDTSDGVGGHAA